VWSFAQELKTTVVNTGNRWDFGHFAVALIVLMCFRCDYLIPRLGLAVARLRWP
jgi:hypothetical protein